MAGSQGKNNIPDPYKNKKNKQGGNNKQSERDWSSLREEWVTTNITLAGLAYKYGIPICTIRVHYYKEDWTRQLAEFNGTVEEEIAKSRQAKAEELANRVSMMDETVLAITERIADVISEQIDKSLNGKQRKTAKEVSQIMKVVSDTLKNVHYNARLSGDKATSIIDDSSTIVLTPEEKKRVENEFGFISKKRISKRDVSCDVDSNKSSQNSQE